MIPKSRKFPMRTDFVRFRAQAKRIVTPHFTVFYRSATRTRYAVVVPAKVSKLATTRNFLKRLTYDTLFALIKEKNLDCVIIYKPLPLTKSSTIKQLIISELNSLHV